VTPPIASIWPRPADPAAAAALIRAAVILGPARTMQQDIDFGLRQLNDIALRALSPAVNDPTTAIEVTLRIGSIMRPLILAELPAQSVRDRAGRVLLTPFDLDHARIHRACIRPAEVVRGGAPPGPDGHRADAAHAARRLPARRGREEVIAALDRQLALTVACCAAEMFPEDRARVQQAATG
jgi:hypothetical protein